MNATRPDPGIPERRNPRPSLLRPAPEPYVTTQKVGRWRWRAWLHIDMASPLPYGGWSEAAAGRRAIRALKRHDRCNGVTRLWEPGL